MSIQLIFGDCLEEMDNLIEKKTQVDLILCDLPYGKIAFKWDTTIPVEKMWKKVNKLIKPSKVICLFGSEPFSSFLRISNIKNYKYDWIWDKKIPSGMSNAKIMPMRQSENISIFIDGKNFYFPIMTKRDKPIKSGGNKDSVSGGTKGIKGSFKKVYTEKYPTTHLVFDKIRRNSLHPTQKPVPLLEYLIKTYTLEEDTVLDFACGSGSTLVACQNLNRNGIGIDNGYCEKNKIVNGIRIKGKTWTEITQLRLDGKLPR